MQRENPTERNGCSRRNRIEVDDFSGDDDDLFGDYDDDDDGDDDVFYDDDDGDDDVFEAPTTAAGPSVCSLQFIEHFAVFLGNRCTLCVELTEELIN